MIPKKENEHGSVMIEVLAVIALLGTMGSLLFRQVIQRNQELDNINIATEMRILKEGFLAYINHDRALLNDTCHFNEETVQSCRTSDGIREDVRFFVPDGYADLGNAEGAAPNDILNMYDFYMYSYQVENRKFIYGVIIPKIDKDSPLPADMSLRRSARVASLIGSDGGVYTGQEMSGTMGGWHLDCNETSCPTLVDGITGIPVVLTGTDMYIPEPDMPENAGTEGAPVLVPKEIAFRRLHSRDYFSVGNGDFNCIEKICKNDQGKDVLCRELDEKGIARDEPVLGAGEKGSGSRSACDPLFWVGSPGDKSSDHSEGKDVYIKNDLHVGRDNAKQTQAFSLESGYLEKNGAVAAKNNQNRQFRVYDFSGKERLILNANGEIIAKTSDGAKTIHLNGERGSISLNNSIYMDGKDGSIIVYEKKSVGGEIGAVYLPSLKIAGGQIQSYKKVTLPDGGDERSYKLDLENTSILNDMRLMSRGGAKLSEILPNYIQKGIYSISFKTAQESQSVAKPECPKGYYRTIVVLPTSWTQGVDSLELSLKPGYKDGKTTTESSSGSGNHSHKLPEIASISAKWNRGDEPAENNSSSITIAQKAPLKINISDSSNSNEWKVEMTYNGIKASDADPISALAQTYCVFDKEKFAQASAPVVTNGSAMANSSGTAPDQKVTLPTESSDRKDVSSHTSNNEQVLGEGLPCETHWDCDQPRTMLICNENKKKCEKITGACSSKDEITNPTADKNIFCIDGERRVLCIPNDPGTCPSNMECINNWCVKKIQVNSLNP